MDEQRFYQKPWFYVFSWTLVGGGFYFWQIRRIWQAWIQEGILPNPLIFLIDIVIFFIGLLVWLAFFAQFVLPVKTFKERQQIFDRLMAHISNSHGPAIFIENGRSRESKGERLKKGPGVLWLDSASAVVTRSTTKFENTFGPGVHFTKKGESIASIVDLHMQNQGIGPREAEDPFAAKKEEQSEEEYVEIQKRRIQVSAWTRDGIEIVPNISVTFKIEAESAKGDDPGSRFGFDPEAVRKAITGEGINPAAPSDAPRRRVAWNQLPALIAADLWREYLAKYTLAELFQASQPGPRPRPPAPPPKLVATQAMDQSVMSSSNLEIFLTDALKSVNYWLARWADKCEFSGEKTVKSTTPPSKTASPPEKEEPKLETALQVINRMIKARMTEAEVGMMDDSGQPGTGMLPSPEFELLRQRGIKVVAASVSNLRFPPNIEDQLVRQWSTTWLENAKAERDRIDRQRGFIELNGQVDAELKYAYSLSKNLLKHQPSKPKDTLKTLILRSRDELVSDDRLHRRGSTEREELENLLQWVERNSL